MSSATVLRQNPVKNTNLVSELRLERASSAFHCRHATPLFQRHPPLRAGVRPSHAPAASELAYRNSKRFRGELAGAAVPLPAPEPAAPQEELELESAPPQEPGAASAPEQEGTSSDGDGTVQIDLELPRRSLLVSFTCNKCNGRTERLVNPVAWQRGMVIAQCASCEAWHMLSDAANLVEEIRYTSDDE